MSITNFDQLLEAGVHFGHLKRKWNPANGSLYFHGTQLSTLSTCIKP